MSFPENDFDSWKDNLRQPDTPLVSKDLEGFEGVLEKMVSLSELMGDLEQAAESKYSTSAMTQRPLLTCESLGQVIEYENRN